MNAATRARIDAALAALSIDRARIEARGLAPCAEARTLAPVGLGPDGRDKFLAPRAARAWLGLRDAAATAGIGLLPVSAFRSIDFQVALIRAKLDKGRTLDDVLQVNAPPGYSEHHGGCALDLGVAGCPPLEEEFEATDAFAWLREHAGRFGFVLSYPRGNAQGYLYEPWHWCFAPRAK